MFYRVHQFTQAFFPRIESEEYNWAFKILSPEAILLFKKQSRPEQRHALDVAKSLLNMKYNLTDFDLQNLLIAALLHDCGKSLINLRLWQRVYIVLMQKMPQTLWMLFENGPACLAQPLKISALHPKWGEQLAQEAALNPQICCLIREHHNPHTELGRLLAKSDNEH